MADGVEVTALREEEFETLLPLIAAYQGFYEVDEIDNDRNRLFFRRFIAPSEDGRLLAARDETGAIIGYACLYWHFSSLTAQETVLMNDLFVAPEARGRGIGRALIEASADVARERGAAWLEWATAPDNHTAQRLYDSMTSEKSTWLEYELDLQRLVATPGRALYRAMVRDEVLVPLGNPVDEGRLSTEKPPADLVPPTGELLLVSIDDVPVAIGGIRDLGTHVAEVKSMYVAPAARRR